jgi:hypothetical protein
MAFAAVVIVMLLAEPLVVATTSGTDANNIVMINQSIVALIRHDN